MNFCRLRHFDEWGVLACTPEWAKFRTLQKVTILTTNWQAFRFFLAILGALGRAALRLLQTTTNAIASEKALKLLYIKFFDKNKWCPEPESNQRHVDFQSTALPTELSGQVLIFILNCKWRRRRDSNPRAAKITTYTLSRGTSSTDLSTSPRFKLFCESCDTYVKRINR